MTDRQAVLFDKARRALEPPGFCWITAVMNILELPTYPQPRYVSQSL